MFQQVHAKLEEAEIAPVGTVDLLHPLVLNTKGTQVDDPNVGKTGCDHEPSQALRIADTALVQVEAPAFLVGKEGFYAHTFAIPETCFLHD